MKKLLSVIGGALVLVVVGVLGAASMQPDTVHIERSVEIAASPADVFPFVNDFDRWITWSPWQGRDPNQTMTFSEHHAGLGAWYEWSGNSDVGKGRMTITGSVDPELVEEDLHFMEPFESRARVRFVLSPVGENTKVVWSFEQDQNLMGKVAGVFMDMEAMVGGDFAAGLATLKPLAESAATARRDAEAAAAAAAAAALPVDPAAAASGDPPADPNAPGVP